MHFVPVKTLHTRIVQCAGSVSRVHSCFHSTKGYVFMATNMATKVDSATSKAQDMQDQYFRVTDQVPGAVWYWGAVASVIVSATLFLVGKRDWSIFVGQWPPTFLLFGLFHKLLGSGR